MTKTASATITFNKPDDARDSDIAPDLIVEDEERNGGAETFAPGDDAFFYVPPGSTVESSAGSLSKVGTNIPYEFTEYLAFDGVQCVDMSYEAMGAVSWEWVGKDRGTPKFADGIACVSDADGVVGVLKVTYDTAMDRWKLTSTVDGPVIVVATDPDGRKDSHTFTFDADEGEDTSPIGVDIEVVDFCSDEPVADASVYVDGAYIGKTDSNGVVYAGMLNPGQQYDLKVIADGYTDSDKDVLANDGFTAPTRGGEVT